MLQACRIHRLSNEGGFFSAIAEALIFINYLVIETARGFWPQPTLILSNDPKKVINSR